MQKSNPEPSVDIQRVIEAEKCRVLSLYRREFAIPLQMGDEVWAKFEESFGKEPQFEEIQMVYNSSRETVREYIEEFEVRLQVRRS